MNKAWITIEDKTLIKEFTSLANEIIDHCENVDIKINESNSSYFVLELVYEDYEEVKEVCSMASYLLLNSYVTEFTVTVNTSDLI